MARVVMFMYTEYRFVCQISRKFVLLLFGITDVVVFYSRTSRRMEFWLIHHVCLRITLRGITYSIYSQYLSSDCQSALYLNPSWHILVSIRSWTKNSTLFQFNFGWYLVEILSIFSFRLFIFSKREFFPRLVRYTYIFDGIENIPIIIRIDTNEILVDFLYYINK